MLIPDLNNNEINEIIEFRKTFPPAGKNWKVISDADPLQEIATQMIFSKKYPEEEVQQWMITQEEIIEKKIKLL